VVPHCHLESDRGEGAEVEKTEGRSGMMFYVFTIIGILLSDLPELWAEEAVVQMVLQEAEGEDQLGQVAVAAVAFDRVKDPRWPDTLDGVIYQPRQFTGMWRRPREYEPEQVVKARRSVMMARQGIRPCGAGVLWYHATSIEKPVRWPEMEVRCVIGGHVFYGDVK
jgi:spore germination cell wall hydrolase CwlJ-like protein